MDAGTARTIQELYHEAGHCHFWHLDTAVARKTNAFEPVHGDGQPRDILIKAAQFMEEASWAGDDSGPARAEPSTKAECVEQVQRALVSIQRRSGQLSSAKAKAFYSNRWRAPSSRGEARPEIGLYRILGDRPLPRGPEQQGDSGRGILGALKQLLDAEPALPGAKKFYVLNRLPSATVAAAATDLITARGYTALQLPFDSAEYQSYRARDNYGLSGTGWNELMTPAFERASASAYLMGANTARNYALQHGFGQGFAWTLPFDGHCFFTVAAWADLRAELEQSSELAYVGVPVVRPPPAAGKQARGHLRSLPQIAFHRSARVMFNPTLVHQVGPKQDLLLRLGIKGPWTPETLTVPPFLTATACVLARNALGKSLPSVCVGDWPARDQEEAARAAAGTAVVHSLGGELAKQPGARTVLAQINAADRVSGAAQGALVKPLFFNLYSMETMRRLWRAGGNVPQVNDLVTRALDRIDRPGFSVTDKPGGQLGVDPRAFQTPGPFDWEASQLPAWKLQQHMKKNKIGDHPGDVSQDWVRWPRHRRPGADLWSEGSERWDATRAIDFYSNFTMFSLTYYYTGQEKFARKAVHLARRWWLDTDTMMLPHAQYADFNRGADKRAHAIMFSAGLLWALDALGLVKASPAWTSHDDTRMVRWCQLLSDWLVSKAGACARDHETFGVHYAAQLATVRRCAGAPDVALVAVVDGAASAHTRSGAALAALLSPGAHIDTPGPFASIWGLVLLWRAGENIGANTAGLRRALADAFATGLGRFTQPGGPGTANVTGSEQRALVCQWARDAGLAPAAPTLSRAQHECSTVPEPGLTLTDPEAGGTPFAGLIW